MINSNLLKNVSLFTNLTRQEVEKIAKIVNVKNVKKGAFLFKKGELRKEFFIVISGYIKLSQSNNKNEEGWAILKENDFISANALIDEKSLHHQTAFAIEESELLVIRGIDYKKLIKNNNAHIGQIISNGFIKGLNHRLVHSTNKLVSLYKTGQIVSDEDDLSILAKKALKVIMGVIKIKKAIFAVFDLYKKEIIILASEGYSSKNEISRKINFADDNISQEILETKNFYRTKNEDSISLKSNYKMNKGIGCPMIFGSKVIGLILLGDKIGGDFSINNEILLKLISNQISGAIYRAGKQEEQRAEEEIKRVYVTN
ncbi:cyclic nucleotide-binding domain-containing protein [Patescibacteria group bacterium]